MTDPQPGLDLSAVRGVIAAADWHVSLAHSAIVNRVAVGAQFSAEQRAAAHELAQLRLEASELVGSDRALSPGDLEDPQRSQEVRARAERIVERSDELRMLFDDDAPLRALDEALDGLLDAVLAVAGELTADAPLPPDDLLWAAQRLAHALEEAEGLYSELGDRVASWRDDEGDLGPCRLARTGEQAYKAHLQAAPERLYAAARALQLAARRGHLVELEAFLRSPQTRVRVGDAWIDVVLLAEAERTFRVRVAGAPASDPTAPGTSDGELVNAIADAAGLKLADLAQRRVARAAAEHARQALDAIVAFRNSGRRGNPQDAARLAAIPASDDADLMPFSHRPDSTLDLVDVLLDLQAERWPVATVLMDSLAAVCRALGDSNDARAGLERLLSHPHDDQAAAEHVRALIEAWTAAALEHEAERLRDPAARRYAVLRAVLELHDQGRPANTANLHAMATKQLVSRHDVDQTITALETDGLLQREDPLAARMVWRLTAEGRALVTDGPER